MSASRSGAIARARDCFRDGSYLDRLRALVAVPTESFPPDHKPDLERYCHLVLGPMIAELGFATEVLPNPEPLHGPILLGTRIEEAAMPTVLLYGHGDVVRVECRPRGAACDGTAACVALAVRASPRPVHAVHAVPPPRRARVRQLPDHRRTQRAGKSVGACHARLPHQNVFSPFR